MEKSVHICVTHAMVVVYVNEPSMYINYIGFFTNYNLQR